MLLLVNKHDLLDKPAEAGGRAPPKFGQVTTSPERLSKFVN